MSYRKQPAEHLDYDIDLSRWLPEGDQVNASSTTIAPTGDPDDLRLASRNLFDDRVKLWLEGGRDGVRYKVTTRIETEAGRIKEVELNISVKDR